MTTAIILCAGSSTRFSGGRENKTLFLLNEKPVFMYSIEKFISCGVKKIVLVVRQNEKSEFEKFLPQLESFNILFASGGKRRQDSVMNALRLLDDREKVLIHDGARPLVSVGEIKRVLEKISPRRCVVPVIPSEDALRIKKHGKLYSLDRKNVVRIQTPQGCVAGELKKLYSLFKQEYFYDDAAAFEKAGFEVKDVEGNKRNIKITTVEDVALANFFLSQRLKTKN